MPFRCDGKDWDQKNPCSRKTNDRVAAAVPFSAWIDKSFKYEDAFQHLVWNLVRAERFRKLVLVLPEWYSPCDYRRPNTYQNQPEERWAGSDTVWKMIEGLSEGKEEFEIEIIRLCDEEAVWSGGWMLEADAWKNYGMPESHAYLIRRFKAMAGEKVEVRVKGAYVHARGEWRVLNSLPEDACLPQ